MKKYNRIVILVTDGLGIGGDKRQAEFGDKGANTFWSVSKTGLLNMPTWKKLGIDSIAKLEGFNKAVNQTAYTARVQESSNAKDTLAGHWEMMGLETKEPFPVFTKNGFPQEMLDEFKKAFDGKEIIGNYAESGTVILDKLAQKQIDKDGVIIYTSADSNVQICGHEEHMGIETLYKYCERVREICNSKPEWKVGRIIARPYIGKNGKWIRTANRHDYAVIPEHTILNDLQKANIKVIGVGKIHDIFGGNGIDEKHKGKTDEDHMDITIDLITKDSKNEFIFVNLVQFDSDFGHRRNPEGFAENVNKFDIKLAKLINAMKDDDLLIITSDHGNDPMWKGSDHTREQVPVTIFSKSFEGKPKKLEDFQGMATIGNIVAKNFGVKLSPIGQDRSEEVK